MAQFKGKKTQPKVNKLEEAKKLIEEQAKKEIELCGKEVNQVLEKHNCTMIVQGRFIGNQIEYQIIINKKN